MHGFLCTACTFARRTDAACLAALLDFHGAPPSSLVEHGHIVSRTHPVCKLKIHEGNGVCFFWPGVVWKKTNKNTRQITPAQKQIQKHKEPLSQIQRFKKSLKKILPQR
ncbi:hypothetical protein WCLP8_3660001 [uncultured Gammaproteobacteria bacterium]